MQLAAREVLKALETGPSAPLLQITGPPTAGKSAVLQAVEESLRTHDRCPILVSPPEGSYDAGPIALVQIGMGLAAHNLTNGDLDELTNGRSTWDIQLRLIKDLLRKHASSVVLLCDEPATWRPPEASPHARFAMHAEDTKLLVLLASAPRVVTGELPTLLQPDLAVAVTKASDPASFLADATRWGVLREEAMALLECGVDLDRFSNLELRLLVGHVSTSSIDEVVAWLRQSRGREIARRLAARLERSGEYADLWSIWYHLAHVRQPIPESLLGALGEDRLSARSRSILRECLLYSLADGRRILHSTLKNEALKSAPPNFAEHNSHQLLALYYARRFADSSSKGRTGGSETGLLEEMEAFHHATEAGDTSLIRDLRVFFSDQLDILGRYFSQARHDNASAVEIFERAIAWDESDDYAHHYLAFNLDVQGVEPTRVADEYSRAVQLRPRSSLWWTRYINFLLIRGRVEDATSAWEDATDLILSPYAQSEDFIYDHLHGWVARTLLYRGELDFAKRVLDDVPESVGSGVISALRRRLTALEEARDHGAFAPANYLEDSDWWRRGPFLLDRREPETEERLVRWLAVRVESTRDAMIRLRGLDISVNSDAVPSTVTTDLSFDGFERAKADEVTAREIEPGMFLELGLYAGGRRTGDPRYKIRVHPDGQWSDESLPRLFPDPRRYLRPSGATA